MFPTSKTCIDKRISVAAWSLRLAGDRRAVQRIIEDLLDTPITVVNRIYESAEARLDGHGRE